MATADLLPTGILRRVADLLLTFVAYLFNLSFDCGTFHSCYKDAFLTPVLKKSGISASGPSPIGLFPTFLLFLNCSSA
jgi:hypothetical protein